MLNSCLICGIPVVSKDIGKDIDNYQKYLQNILENLFKVKKYFRIENNFGKYLDTVLDPVDNKYYKRYTINVEKSLESYKKDRRI